MKKKILFILHIPPPVNGAAVMGQYVKDSVLINQKFETDFINLTTSYKLSNIGRAGFHKIRVIYSILKNILKAQLHKKYDACYVSLTAKGMGFYKDLFVVTLLKVLNQNIVYHFHNKGVKEFSKRGINRFLYNFVFRNSKVILLSPRLYEDVKQHVTESNVYYCPNGIKNVSMAYSEELNQMNEYEDGVCKFLFLSNMINEKGVMELLNACHLLSERNQNFECHFVGAWSDISEEAFHLKVSELGMSNKVFAHGKKYNEDKLDFFRKADVFVFPTYYHNETFGLVLLEAMQAGLPVISTYEGGIPDVVIDGVTGLLVEQKNTIMLAEKMEYLINEPEIRRKMGKEGKNRYLELYQLQMFENRLAKILEDVIVVNENK